jgi:hypothetical protein
VTALFDGLGIAGAHSDSALIDTAGGLSIFVGTASSSLGWGLLAPSATSSELVLGAASGVGRVTLLAAGWGTAGVQASKGFGLCFAYADCDEETFHANAVAAQAKAARTFWVTTDIAIGLSAADVATQLVVGYLQRDSAPGSLAHVAPVLLPTGDKLTPGLAWSGQF